MAQQDGFLTALLQNLTGDAALKAAAFGLPGGASAATPVLGQDGSISFAQLAAPQGRFAGLKQGVQKALPYLGDVLSAIAASDPENGRGWAGQAIGSVVQRQNVQQWNDLQNRLRQAQVLQEQQQQQQLQTETAAIAKQLGLPVGDKAYNDLSNLVTAGRLSGEMKGAQVGFDLNTGVTPDQIDTQDALTGDSVLNQYGQRMATVGDNKETLRQAPAFQAAGMSPAGGLPGFGAPTKQQQAPQAPQAPEQINAGSFTDEELQKTLSQPQNGFLAGLMQGAQQPQTINGGIEAVSRPNAYTTPVADPQTLLNATKIGVERLSNNRANALGQGELVLSTKKLAETERSNKAEEGLKSTAIRETIRSNRVGEGLKGAEVAISKANSEATIAAKKAEASGNPVAGKQLLAVNQSINTLYKGLKDGLYKGDTKEAALAQLDSYRQTQKQLTDAVVGIVSGAPPAPAVGGSSSGGAAAAYRRKIGLGG